MHNYIRTKAKGSFATGDGIYAKWWIVWVLGVRGELWPFFAHPCDFIARVGLTRNLKYKRFSQYVYTDLPALLNSVESLYWLVYFILIML